MVVGAVAVSGNSTTFPWLGASAVARVTLHDTWPVELTLHDTLETPDPVPADRKSEKHGSKIRPTVKTLFSRETHAGFFSRRPRAPAFRAFKKSEKVAQIVDSIYNP